MRLSWTSLKDAAVREGELCTTVSGVVKSPFELRHLEDYVMEDVGVKVSNAGMPEDSELQSPFT